MFPEILGFERALPYLIGAFLGGYFVGGLPFGLWLGRAFGLGDVRETGSGNIGATNLLRAGGWAPGALTLLLDVAKGFLCAWLGATYGPLMAVCAGFGAFLGHCYSPYLGFRGGKGVATGFGAFLAWRWEIGLICLGVWLAIAAGARLVSLASLGAALAAAFLFPYFEIWDAAWAVFAMALITLWRHRANVGRLLRGVEPKIGARS